MALSIKTNERIAFIGRTGSGKTFLAERLTAGLRRLVIIDPNEVLTNRFLPHVPWEKGIKYLEEGREARLYVSEDNPAAYERYFRHIYEQVRQVVVYIDEAYGVAPPNVGASDALWALYTRGRARGIGMWASTQRPRFIPRFMLSESEWFFVFQLQLADDRDYIARITHAALRRRVPDRHGFYYYNIHWDKPHYTRELRT